MEKFEKIIEIVVPALTAIFGWLIGRQKNKIELDKLKSEADRSEIDNAEKVLSYYKDIIDDLASRLEEAKSHISLLEKELKELKEQLNDR